MPIMAAGFGRPMKVRGSGPRATERPVYIDIWTLDGLETGRPGRHDRGRDKPRCFIFGPVERCLQDYQDSPMKVRNSLKSLRGRHRNNRLVRRKGRVYVINKVQRRFKARQG